MMKQSLVVVAALIIGVASSEAAEIPKLEKKEWIDSKAAAALTNETEIRLHAIRLPEVRFGQAHLFDCMEFLNKSIQERANTAEARGIRIAMAPGITIREDDATILTLGAKDISVLEVLEFFRRVGWDHRIDGQSVMLVRAAASNPVPVDAVRK